MGPLVFSSYPRPMVWGQRRLATRLGKALPTDGPYGEAWEVSGHRAHVSVVAEGPLAGTTLAELCTRHADDLYGESARSAVFPLLVKYLDAHDWLSVQVHPDDRQANRLAPGEGGKTEAWVVLYAEAGARIWAGLEAGVGPADLERHLDRGTVVECLHVLTPKAGDCLFLPAGTVHAVGGGVLLAEVQQTSDATFRLYDWDRVQPDGTRRPLHIAQSLAVIDWDAGPVDPVVPRGDELVACPFFALDRFALDRARSFPATGRATIWLVLDGGARLQTAGYDRPFRAGETVLVPAAASDLEWLPDAQATLLRVRLPDRGRTAVDPAAI